jgi:hypothetical protein
MKLESVEKAHNGTNKYKAVFCLCPNGKGGCLKPQKKEVYFGSKGYLDYTIGATDGQRKNYIARHDARENFNDPLTAGSLSRWILWGESRDIDVNIAAFKKRFGI